MLVRTRIAPSPTGEPHIGNFYTALINYAFAQKNRGQFIVRIEDTDRTRFVEDSEEKIYQALDWLGLNEDESPRKKGPYAPYRQSKRLEIYQKYAQELVDKGAAYPCFCSAEKLAKLRKEQQKKGQPPKYNRACLLLDPDEVQKRIQDNQPHVIRLKIPDEGATFFNDLVRGRIEFENKLIDHQILIKSDGFPTYHLAVVVDDHLMKISHVIRAEEWISSTPKHILLHQALGWPIPYYAHLPLLRNPDQSKLSKRKNPISVLWYKDQGFLPEAVKNYLTHLGWTHPEEKEIYSFEEFLEKFELGDIKSTAPIFDLEKLKWVNSQYIKEAPSRELSKLISAVSIYHPESEEIEPILPLIRERIKTIKEYDAIAGYLHKRPLVSQDKYHTDLIKAVVEKLEKTNWTIEQIEKELRTVAAEKGVRPKDLFMETRIIISGSKVSLPLFESIKQLGKEEVLERLRLAIRNK